MKTIKLTKGYETIVDDADYPGLSRYSWQAVIHNGGVYARRTDNFLGKDFYMHRQLLGLKQGNGRQGDHKNGDTLDNQRSNLRVATRSQNKSNSRRLTTRKSGYRGVWLHRLKYRACIKYDGKNHDLGGFDSPIEAAQAYDQAAKVVFGEFAKLNFN